LKMALNTITLQLFYNGKYNVISKLSPRARLG
jgi:hypothetical protein